MSPVLQAFLDNRQGLKRSLTKYVSRAADIEDILQETFLRGFSAEARGEIRAPKAFLFQIAKNVALNEMALKSNSSTQTHADFDAKPVLGEESRPGLDEQLESRRKLVLFTEAVAHLPPRCRQAFLMQKFDGMKAKDIARTLNITVSGVEKHIATALLKCSDYLAARGHEPADYGGKSNVQSAVVHTVANIESSSAG
jgi:RNA polymerase sigma-70 factor (ECF subfamily)